MTGPLGLLGDGPHRQVLTSKPDLSAQGVETCLLYTSKGALGQLQRLSPNKFQPVIIYQFRLGQHHQAALDAQERQNIQMLYGLGHNAFVRGDDQQDVYKRQDRGRPGLYGSGNFGCDPGRCGGGML